MNETIKRHIVSAAITFLSTFFVVLGIQIEGNFVDTESVTYGLIVSSLITAGRAGIKAVIESLR